MKKIIAFLFTLSVLPIYACSLYKYAPRTTEPIYMHQSGIYMYNKSGEEIDDAELKNIFGEITKARELFKNCAKNGESFLAELPKYPIIIAPARDIYVLGVDISGFTDQAVIFLRRDRLWKYTILHEWLHLYLYYTGKRFLGDIFHRDRAFKKCNVG